MALIKELCLPGIQIFGFCISQNTSAEGDTFRIHIQDRDHHPIPELIMGTLTFVKIHQPGIPHDLVREATLLQILVQIIGINIRKSKAELRNGLIRKTTLFRKIRVSQLSTFCFRQDIMEVRSCCVIHIP